jgi:hypothetical protein
MEHRLPADACLGLTDADVRLLESRRFRPAEIAPFHVGGATYGTVTAPPLPSPDTPRGGSTS